MVKFADDTYILIPASNQLSSEAELRHVSSWADHNNLRLNISKSIEIIFRARRSHPHLPPLLPGLPRATSIKMLGITISDDLCITEHISNILGSCSQSLHGLRILRAHGLNEKHLHTVFTAVVVSKLRYSSSAWRGLLRASDTDRLEAFLRKSKRYGYCSPASPSITDLFDQADSKLFRALSSSPFHPLSPLLPPSTHYSYNLRPRRHSLKLTPRTALSSLNFITRMLFSDCY